jgi:hypothetical protein
VAALPLDAGTGLSIYRLIFLPLRNNVAGWYRLGTLSSAQIGEQIMRIFCHGGIYLLPARGPSYTDGERSACGGCAGDDQ